jgi:glucuronosyltransferase
MRFVSELMRDQKERPLDRAVYWIEYVTRHGGAQHLRSASRKLALYQRGLLDVTLIVVAVSAILAYAAYLFFVWTVSKWSSSTTSKSVNNNKLTTTTTQTTTVSRSPSAKKKKNQ